MIQVQLIIWKMIWFFFIFVGQHFFHLPVLFFSVSLTIAKSSYQLHKNVINGCGQLIIHAFPGPFLPRSAELGNIYAEQSSDDIISTMAPVNGPITHYAPPYLNSCWDEVRSISLFNMFQISQLVLRDLAINIKCFTSVNIPKFSPNLNPYFLFNKGQCWFLIR